MNRFLEIPEDPVVVLIRPPINRWKLYKWYEPFGSREPSFGLVYIASHIESKGYKVSILDGEVLGERKLYERINIIKPDVVGITSTTFSFSEASTLATKLRQKYQKCLIILGGSHASALPVESLNKDFAFDGVVVGEGEETMLEVIQKHKTPEINGLVWKKDSASQPISNRPREITDNLDNYNQTLDLLDGFPLNYAPPFQTKKKNSVSLVVSRGCFYDCSFCTASRLNKRKIRFHSPEYVIQLMEALEQKYGIKDFYFHDDYFSVYSEWMMKFCDGLINLNRNYTWSCVSRVETLSEEILYQMKKSGCRQIAVGVESGSQRVLDNLSKKIKLDVLSHGLNRITSTGIKLKALFILDTPGETWSDHIKTIKLIFRHNFSHVQFNYYTPLPGSRDYYIFNPPDSLWQKMSLRQSLGYSKIYSFLYPVIEISFYLLSYLKVSVQFVLKKLSITR